MIKLCAYMEREAKRIRRGLQYLLQREFVLVVLLTRLWNTFFKHTTKKSELYNMFWQFKSFFFPGLDVCIIHVKNQVDQLWKKSSNFFFSGTFFFFEIFLINYLIWIMHLSIFIDLIYKTKNSNSQNRLFAHMLLSVVFETMCVARLNLYRVESVDNSLWCL